MHVAAGAAMLAPLSLLIWLYLFLAHGRFWLSAPQLPAAAPPEFPEVDIVVPARDEAPTIAAVIGSLLAQDYAGRFRVILVDDNSTDGTAAAVANAGWQRGHGRVVVVAPAGCACACRRFLLLSV